MLDSPETIWLGVMGVGFVCGVAIYVAVKSP
jgi:hypothetical protein